MGQAALKFDPDLHAYYLGERRIINVTTALGLGGFPPSQYFTEEGRIRGQSVHDHVFLDIHDDLEEWNLHPLVAGYVAAWFKFRRECRFEPIVPLCEKIQHHPVHDYCGKPDIVCYINGRPAVVDVKTGASSTARYQIAAYAEFPNIAAVGPLKRFDLRLLPSGNYRLTPHTDPNDWLKFIDCLKKARSVWVP